MTMRISWQFLSFVTLSLSHSENKAFEVKTTWHSIDVIVNSSEALIH